MYNKKRNIVLRFIRTLLGTVLVSLVFSSCESIYEDIAPCPHGVSLRFIYDYNMEYANAFPEKVDCLTLLVYDDKGNYVDTRIVTGTELQDENYRMVLDLEQGNYHFVAYGGLACDKHSFHMNHTPGEGTQYTDLRVEMDPECLTVPERKNLHGLYWGELVLATSDFYSEGVVEMMKNTNNIRIVLQQIDGNPVNDKDFDFEITDDNTLFNYDNNLLENGMVTYTPWSQGQVGLIDGGKEAVGAYAELSTSRLMVRDWHSPRLIIRYKASGEEIINLPLVNCLLMLRSNLYAHMEPQEFLDRESEWSVVFFLSSDLEWTKTIIKINNCDVRPYTGIELDPGFGL